MNGGALSEEPAAGLGERGAKGMSVLQGVSVVKVGAAGVTSATGCCPVLSLAGALGLTALNSRHHLALRL